ncbi:MAG: uroporphyrinogen-III C-methyltransferase [Burkholderiales bacterium]|nr:uroporphyrinogen-III C-methyltransferase [Burkholderiales bacterium]
MNELPSSAAEAAPAPQPAAAAVSNASPATDAGDRRDRAARRVFTIALSVLAAMLVIQWFTAQSQISGLRSEVAQRLQGGDSLNNETRLLAKSVQESVKELQGKVSVLESRQSEAQSQQLALEQLYQELSKNRDDWALAEVEQVLSTASQQLQLAGNVQGALIALQNADRSLARSDKPQFIVIRRAIARDLEKLKALPQLDVAGIAVRLDSAIGQIDGMPLLSDEKPPVTAAQPKNAPARSARSAHRDTPASSRAAKSEDWTTALRDKWDSWANEMWLEVKQLIRVRNVETPDALLMSPTQAYYARENLKLRLLNARLALLSRDERAFRSDLVAAQETIVKYFDTRAKQTQTVQTLLKQVQGSNLSIQMPTLVDSLNAVRNYKAR